MAQLVTGQVIDPGAPAGPADDLVDPVARQRAAPVRALEDQEDPVGARIRGPLGVQVAGEGGEEPRRDRHDPLMPALALGDEQPALADLDITQPQAEDLAAAQPAEQHRLDHRPVAVGAQHRHQRVDLGREQDARQRPGARSSGVPRRAEPVPARRAAIPRGTGLARTPASPRATR